MIEERAKESTNTFHQQIADEYEKVACSFGIQNIYKVGHWYHNWCKFFISGAEEPIPSNTKC